MTIEKLLDYSEWSFVEFLRALQQLEVHSKLPVQGIGIVADDVEATAFDWAVESKCAHYYMSPGPNCARHLAHVSGAVALFGEKMKHGSVMPHVVSCDIEIDSG